MLTGRLRSALQRLNPEVPAGTIKSALLQLANTNLPGLLESNCNFHRWMTKGLHHLYGWESAGWYLPQGDQI